MHASRIGNITLDPSFYLIGNPASNDPWILDSFGFNWNTVPWGDTFPDKYSHLKSRGFQRVPSSGGGCFMVPLKQMLGSNMTNFETYYGTFDTTNPAYNRGEMYIKPNIDLSILGGATGIYIDQNFTPYGSTLWGIGVPVYTDNTKTTLTAVVIPYAYLTTDAPPEEHGGRGTLGAVNINYFKARGYNVTITTGDDEYGDDSDEAGYGTDGSPDFDHHSDIIGVPTDPTVSTGTVGFMNVYHVGSGALATLSQYLFPAIDPSQWVDVTTVLRGIAGMFAYRDSIQYVVDLHAIPVAPTDGASKYVKLGNLTTDISQPVCSSDYVNFDCGSVSIPERFRNFLDYTEVTCRVYIPFVGFVDLQPEYWAGGSIGLKYKFNVIDGSFMAYLVSSSSKSNLTNTLIGQYSGCACLHLPVVAASYGSIVGGLVSGSAAMSAAGAAAKTGKGTTTGNSADALQGAISAGNVQPSMSQSNDYNCSAAYLGCRQPYLIIEYPVQSFSANYPHEKGLPANFTRIISSMLGSGFTVISNIDLTGVGITSAEIEELKSLFAEGIYL